MQNNFGKWVVGGGVAFCILNTTRAWMFVENGLTPAEALGNFIAGMILGAVLFPFFTAAAWVARRLRDSGRVPDPARKEGWMPDKPPGAESFPPFQQVNR